jgi:hypothetical protein
MTQNSSHHDQGDSRLGGPLIWIITALLALVAIALIVSILPSKRMHEPPTGYGLSEKRIHEPPTTVQPITKPR